MKRAISPKLVAFLLFYTLWPPLVLAQEPKAGVVTTLHGAATVARAPVPQETPLKFKDDVFYRDRISTKEDSIVRVLLGGKALITVRELSVLTITEEPGRAVVEMQSGKVALAVARQLLRPGEAVEVRTPNAIAAVRGTVMIVEVGEAPAPGAPGPAVPVTNVHCLRGVCRYAHRGSHLPEQDLPQGFTGSVEGANVKPPAPSPPGVGQGYQPPLQPSNEGQGQAAQQGQDQTAALFGAPGAGPPPSTPPPNGTPSQGLPSTSSIGTNQNPGGGAGGPPACTPFCNGSFEGGMAPWTPTGNASVVPFTDFAGIVAPDGTKMAKIQTNGLGSLSAISQGPFSITKPVVVSFKYKVLTNEDLDVGFNDGFFVKLFVNGTTFPVLTASLTGLDVGEGVTVLSDSFEAPGTGGFAQQTQSVEAGGFFSFSELFGPAGGGNATLAFTVEDDAFGEACSPGEEECDDEVVTGGAQTAVLIDAVTVTEDPPLLLVRDGARYVSTQREPLFSFANETRTFDSLLLVCCAKGGQPSSVELAGPLMRATNSNLTVPFFLVGVLPGGFLSSSTTDPLVLVEGGSSSLGSMIGVFDIQGSGTALDLTTGLTLGTDRSLQTGGELFRADQGASVTSNRLLKVDTALLEASAPLLHLMNGSSMTSASSLMSIGPRANVIANVPSDALVKLNASTLIVNNGSLVNVGGGSVLSVTGNLVSLTNGSTLNILNGSLVSISGGSVFRLTGGSLGAFGAGTNALNITNAAPLCAGCSLTTSVPNFGGYPVLLRNGAVASSVTVAPGFTPFAGLNGSNTVKVSGPSGAVLAVGGPTSKVTLGP